MVELGDDDVGQGAEGRPFDRLRTGLPRAIAFTGAGACTIFSQARQLYLGRMVRTTRHCTGTASSISSLSCPSGRSAPPQSGQVQSPCSGSIRCSSRGR